MTDPVRRVFRQWSILSSQPALSPRGQSRSANEPGDRTTVLCSLSSTWEAIALRVLPATRRHRHGGGTDRKVMPKWPI